MNILKTLLFGLPIFFTLTTRGQNHYVLDLKAEKWNFKPVLFYISDVLDDRINKSNAGKVLSGNKLSTAEFKNSPESDLKNLIDSSMEQDTTMTPVSLSLERFELKETGTVKNHKVVLDFSLKFYRIINEKRYKLYEAKGKPELVMQGNYSNAPEKIISESLKKVIKGFNDWINEHADLPPLANKVNVIFEQENYNTNNEAVDSIIWTENYRLKWSDFKGSQRAATFMAQSNCLFTYQAEPKINRGILELHIHLNACFDRKHSWVKNGQQKDTLLAHEQLHFDICELNIRHLRKRLLNSTLNPMEFDTQIKTLFDQVWNEYQNQQQHYDEETGHGIITDKQQYWQAEIRSQLKNTSTKK